MDARTASAPDILQRIVAHERQELPGRMRARPTSRLRSEAGWTLPRRSLRGALESRDPAVIAECKRRSPSRGVLRDPFDPVAIARSYERAGAAAISVLTNAEFFGGSLDDLAAVRAAVGVPVLRKEFVVDEYQVEEARAAGADAILLIVAVLEPARLRGLADCARGHGIETLVEVHDEHELDAALACGGDVVGVNNRDLRTFTVDLATSERVAARAPGGTRLVAESGIRDAADVARLRAHGIHAFLVGEAFMTAADPGAALADLLRPSPGASA
ncbi:MAG: indole-3-glycerol phosphate synthase TrpC [Alphaproteobacteria bacterium]